MTIKEHVIKHLEEHDLWPEEAKVVFDKMIEEQVNEPMKGRWNDRTTDYPPAITNLACFSAKNTALEHLKATRPQHFAITILTEMLKPVAPPAPVPVPTVTRRRHEEQKEDEIFLTNTAGDLSDTIYKTLRLGLVAYDKEDKPVKGLRPAFVKTSEVEEYANSTTNERFKANLLEGIKRGSMWS